LIYPAGASTLLHMDTDASGHAHSTGNLNHGFHIEGASDATMVLRVVKL